MIGMQVREKDPLNVAPSNSDLGQALQRSASRVEQEAFLSRFHQNAGAKAVHHRGWATGPEQCHPDGCSLGLWPNGSRVGRYEQDRHARKTKNTLLHRLPPPEMLPPVRDGTPSRSD